MLFDLDRARRQGVETHGKCEAVNLMAKAWANLMWQLAEV